MLTPSTSRLLPGDNDAAPSTSRRQSTAPPTWHCVRGGRTARPTADLVWRAANASCSLWSRTLAGNAAPAKTVVGSGKRPTQTAARRLLYGVARTVTSDCSASRGRHHCRDRWIYRISCYAEEQATRTRVSSFWASSVDGWRARYCAAGVAALTGSEHSPGASTSAHREPGYVMTLVDRCSRAHCCGIICSTDNIPTKTLTSYFVVELPRWRRSSRARSTASRRSPGG